MAEAKNKARLQILGYLAQFSLQRRIGGQVYGGLKDCAFEGDTQDAIPGDLVALQSAPFGKWYLGWLISKEWPEGWAGEQYLIESIEDGELCNWSNVGLIHYNRETVRNHPEWRWTDAQFDFKERWWNVCYKDKDAYIYLPTMPVFDDKGVELGVRVRFGISQTVIREHFPNWRKVTKKMMAEFYDTASAALQAEKKAPAD